MTRDIEQVIEPKREILTFIMRDLCVFCVSPRSVNSNVMRAGFLADCA